jgi:nitrate reductase NapAB chaperone NapD
MSSVSDISEVCPDTVVDEPCLISSYLAFLSKGRESEVLAQIQAIEGAEVHGCEHNQHVVTIEAASVADTYKKATAITRIEGVITFSLVHFNFEDETLGKNSKPTQ